jgi:AcrR family transcriptional regulator
MTQTPWGNVADLRSRRLPPGPGSSREEVTTNQRERLMAAMVGSVAEHGYEATRVADVIALSGVSRSAFYRHFEDKRDCFLATLDEIGELAAGRIRAAYDGEKRWDARLRAAADAFLELATAQPAAAQVYFIDVYAAGPEAVARLDRAVGATERGFSRAFEDSPERAGMPRDVVRAIVGGINKAVHSRLRRGQERELAEVLPDLIEWALSYHAPKRTLRHPRRAPSRGAAPERDSQVPVERLLNAVTETVAARGYPDATIVEIADRASASLSTFYASFDTKEEAFVAALERARDDSLAATLPAVVQAPDWPRGVRDGLDALFGYLAAEPNVASIAAVHSFAAGKRAIETGDSGVSAFQAFLAEGYERAPELEPIVAEAIGGAVYALVYGQIRRDRIPRMRELAPTATFVALTPFTGADEACAVSNEPLRVR